MKIEQRKIADVKPYPNNPRQNEGTVEKVMESIKKYGWQQPIVVDKEGVIIVGHTRFEAAKRLKMKTVPVHVADKLTPEEARSYRLEDNRVGESSEWDYPKLISELEALKESGIDLGGIGFSDADVAAYQKMIPSEPTPLAPPGSFPEVGENIHIDHICPKCGYKFSGGATSADPST